MYKYSEDNLLMLSALQHLLFCPRQCALIHIEQLWVENRFTAEGRIMHERVHQAGRESRRDRRIEYDLPLRSFTLGLTGRADVVEFHKDDDIWQPYPVEYKRGKPKKDHCDRVQLCAQALCLEEMLEQAIPEGALFYGQKHRRQPVLFDEELRRITRETASSLHELIDSQQTPPPVYNKRCISCSFVDICLPRAMAKKRSVTSYLKRILV
jgi:CRISPR-associated exonuclease Cas4